MSTYWAPNFGPGPQYQRGPAGWEYSPEYVLGTNTENPLATLLTSSSNSIQDGESMIHDYEITLTDGSRRYLERIHAVNVGGAFISFNGLTETGGQKLVEAFRNDAVLSYRPLPPSEEIVRPKHTFLVTLRNNGGIKTVQADMFKVSIFGLEKVYEFFSKTSSGTAREELSIPFGNVLMVERVDDALDKAVAAEIPTHAKAQDDLPMPEPLDYDEVVRPKRKS